MPVVLRTLSEDEAAELSDRGWTNAGSLRVRPRTWLVPDRIVSEAVSIVEGDAQAGKSSWLSGLAAAVTSGRAYCGRPKQAPADVLWCAGEEIYDVDVTPRLVAAGADMARVHYPIDPFTNEPLLLSVPEHTRQLQAALQAHAAKLLILDPLACYASAECDLRTEAGARSVMDALGAIARRCQAAVIVLRHWKKGRSGPRMLWGFGSAALSGAARSIVSIERPNPLTERRLMRTVRCAGGGQVPSAEFYLDRTAGAPTVTGWKQLTIAEDEGTECDERSGDRDVRRDCEQLLRALLGSGEEVKATVILEQARSVGCERSLRAVKERWEIPSRFAASETPPCWYWKAPAAGMPASTDAPLQPCSLAGDGEKKPRKSSGKKPGKSKAARLQRRVGAPPEAPAANTEQG